MPTPTTTQYFAQDHDQLDDIFNTFRTEKYRNHDKAKEALERFKHGLERHILREEELLFPLWEEKTGMAHGGPTSIMRGEHRHIGERVEALGRKVQNENPDTGAEEQALMVLLSAHNMKEERVLYPSLDKLASDEERDELYEKMKLVSGGHSKVGCGRD
jgi:regulator of cell morphogenesis and NO signaling